MVVSILNPILVKKQGLTIPEVLELENLHELRERTFSEMERLDPTNEKDLVTLKIFAELIESLEYNMQRVWKFDQDKSKHTWWFRIPHCTCPKIDNSDPIYMNRIINSDCPIHGK